MKSYDAVAEVAVTDPESTLARALELVQKIIIDAALTQGSARGVSMVAIDDLFDASNQWAILTLVDFFCPEFEGDVNEDEEPWENGFNH